MKTIRLLLITTIILALIQIVLGITVRVTGSGLGCPDWPTCYGNWIPPLRFDSIIEYTHRLSASSLGLVTFITLGFLWFKKDLLRVSFSFVCLNAAYRTAIFFIQKVHKILITFGKITISS